MAPFVARVAAALIVVLISVTSDRSYAQETVAGIKTQVGASSPADESRVAQPQWGTSALGVRTVHALSFQESDSTMAFSYALGSTSHRHRSGAGFFMWFDAALTDLPAGAEITGLELEGCDTSASQAATAILFYRDAPTGPTNSIGSVSTGTGATPGCAFFGGTNNLPPFFHVDNRNKTYWIRVELGATDATTTFGAVRVFYKLRVSPGPGAATFADVPTPHPFFPYVEALVASGITGGCGGGNYCPDAPVTRGQMAVFLSVALGLHFPF